MVRKAYVDKEICIGCSLCNTICPEVFLESKQNSEYGGDFKSDTVNTVNHEEVTDKVDDAIQQCPVQCISWRDESSGGETKLTTKKATQKHGEPNH
ncbi:TPA: ferredoxin [archaeon]|uniref:Ferredoxin n=1 Tax=Candidatus Naiadarchaeum limnaeum TaxID=2756139 RepID=A0A832UMY6_9ARCH|nr:ferredoxin [Candidatus Naiadarchaeum limnaeum]